MGEHPVPTLQPPESPADATAPPDPAQDRADVIVIAAAILALYRAAPAIARQLATTDLLLATGVASHLAEMLDSTADPSDHDAAFEANGAECFTNAIARSAEVMRDDGSTVPAP